MGFLDNVKDALKGAVSTRASKHGVAADNDTTTADGSLTPAPPTIPEDTAEEKFETYTVKSGDTLSEICARVGVSYQEIARINNIENPDLIFPGQVFRIPQK